MTPSERSVLAANYPRLAEALAAGDLLADRAEHYLRAQDRNAAGLVGDRFVAASESRLKQAVAAVRQANETWRLSE